MGQFGTVWDIKNSLGQCPIPILATSTGVRNRQTLVHKNGILAACDHDFTKLSLTPSVIFLCNIPKKITESFYSEDVYVSYKDTVFEPSSAIRHCAEFFNTL